METNVETTITWAIRNFSSMKSEFIYSDHFVAGGCKWRLLAYPKGSFRANHLSLFLNVSDKETLPIGWRRHAKFSLTIVNQYSETLSLLQETQHWFEAKSTNYDGFSKMINLGKLIDNNGFVVNGELRVVVKLQVLEVVGKLDVSDEYLPLAVTIDVNGFELLPLQVKSAKSLFERHQDLASKFSPKNTYLKTAYMNFLLSLTQTVCQSTQEFSNDDLSDAGSVLAYLREAGFKLDWLEKKLDEVKKKKKKEEACLARLQEMDEQLQLLKMKCLEQEAHIAKEKEELLAARTPLSLYDDNVV